jgi:arylsulfatase A-like enzyme
MKKMERKGRTRMRGIHLVLLLMLWPLLVAGQDRPNVVYILGDDVGLGDIGFYHRERTGESEVVPTPHLDSLIEAGMRFDRAHSSTALCSPTRYCVLSGNYAHRSYDEWGVWASFNTSPFADKFTVGNVMQEAGYRTGFIGKWHLGGDFLKKGTNEIYTHDVYGRDGKYDARQIVGGGPSHLGFDYALCLPAGIQNAPYAVYENGDWMPLGADSELKWITWKDVPKGTSLGKSAGIGDSNWDASQIGPLLADKATNFIHEAAKQDDPFFLCYFTQAVHHPHNPPKTFNGIPVKGTMGNGEAHHLDMVKELDLQVGEIIKALKATGQYDNTLLIFTSDNGGLGKHIPGTKESGHDSTNGLRGSKQQIWEGGHRVPFLAVWPGKIRPGSSAKGPALTHDLMATLYAVTGQCMPDDKGLDSWNLLPTLLGKEDAKLRMEYTVTGQGNNLFEILYYKGPWKLAMRGKCDNMHSKKLSREFWQKRSQKTRPEQFEPIALFNMENNPYEDETGNLVGNTEYQTVLQSLLNDYESHRNAERTTPRVPAK